MLKSVVLFCCRGNRLASLTISVLFLASEANADSSFAFCEAVDLGNKRDYFSEVFEGDWKKTAEFKNGFNEFLAGHYGMNRLTAVCFAENERGAAKEKRDSMEADSRRRLLFITETGWVY